MKKSDWVFTALAAALCAVQSPLQAQGFPDKPVRIIGGYAPGGTIDTLARLTGQPLSERLGVPVVVEQRPGAGGAIAAAAVAKAPKDGYTLLFSADSLIITPLLRKDLPYDPADFAPLTRTITATVLLAVNPKVPAKTLGELIQFAKANPGSLRYASPGAGTAHHLLFEMLKYRTGTDIPAVQYKGNVPAVADVVAGQPEVLITGIVESQAFIASGQLRALAAMGEKRLAAYPSVPSSAESGYPELTVGAFLAFFTQSGVPPNIINRLSDEIATVAAAPDIRQRLTSLGMEANILKGDAFAVYLRTLTDRYREAIVAGGIKID